MRRVDSPSGKIERHNVLSVNVPLKIVSERLGHASITMTADTYSQVTEQIQHQVTDQIADLLRQKYRNKIGTMTKNSF